MLILLLGFAVILMALISAAMGFGALQTSGFLLIGAILIVIWWQKRHKAKNEQ